MMIEPRCGVCAHSGARAEARAQYRVRLFCFIACGDAADYRSADRVQAGQRACVHFEREPGAEGDATC